MIAAVFDANVIVSGAGWRGDSHLCLLQMARRRVRVFTSPWILEEASRHLVRLQADGTLRKHDPWPLFLWFRSTARIVTPAPTGKPRSRDPKDDPILGTALAARARLLVTGDKDLLDLEKPFGVEIVRPAAFLDRFHRPL